MFSSTWWQKDRSSIGIQSPAPCVAERAEVMLTTGMTLKLAIDKSSGQVRMIPGFLKKT